MGASPYLSHLPLADVSSTLAKSTTPAVAGSIRRIPGGRYAYPGLCSGALAGRSFPSPIDNARRGGLNSPHSRGCFPGFATLTPGCVLAPCQGAHSHRQSTTPAVAGVFPPRMSLTPAPRASFPLAIYGEGVAVRPGVRSFPSLAFKPLDRAIVRLFLVVANAD